MVPFIPIKTSRVSEDVLNQIKSSILSGAFKPGSKLPSERELTHEFRVSRGVVREAIRMLEISGFLTVRQGHGGGTYVTDLTLNHVGNAFLDLFQTNRLTMSEVAQVRLYIEPEVARLAAGNYTPQHSTLLQKAEAGELIHFASIPERISRLTAVHRILATICGNQFFEAIVRAMVKITSEMVLMVWSEPNSLHGPGEHKKIITAVKAGDGPLAAAEMALHLEKFSAKIVAMEKEYRRKMRMDE